MNLIPSIASTYFYPRPPRGGRPLWLPLSFLHAYISIHALREEGDTTCFNDLEKRPNFYPRPPRGGRPRLVRYCCAVLKISIHALREEGDNSAMKSKALNATFLSTPSARRATSRRP